MTDDGRCQYVIKSGPFEGQRCRNKSVNGTGFCGIHSDSSKQASDNINEAEETYCYIGGGTDYAIKTIANALMQDDGFRLSEIGRILYNQFPSKIDESIFGGLAEAIKMAGFEPRHMEAQYDRNDETKLKKGKDDHRHWRDTELGVSPHTLKQGIAEGKKHLMGKCKIRIEER